jgi:hypothetical protein
MVRSLEVIGIFLGPLPLTRSFAGLAAVRFPAVDLGLGVTVIGEEDVLATRALPFSGAFHGPEPPGHSSDARGSKGRKTRKAGNKTEESIGKLTG